MQLRIIRCELYEVHKYLVFIFFLGDIVPLLDTDIVFCSLAVKEAVEHIGILLQLIHCKMIFGEKQVVKLNMICIVAFNGPCHYGFSAPGMPENEAYVCFTRIEAVFPVVEIRFRNNDGVFRQIQVFKDVFVRDQFFFQEVIHYRHVMTQEFV